MNLPKGEQLSIAIPSDEGRTGWVWQERRKRRGNSVDEQVVKDRQSQVCTWQVGIAAQHAPPRWGVGEL